MMALSAGSDKRQIGNPGRALAKAARARSMAKQEEVKQSAIKQAATKRLAESKKKRSVTMTDRMTATAMLPGARPEDYGSSRTPVGTKAARDRSKTPVLKGRASAKRKYWDV